MPNALQSANSLPPDVRSKHWTETVPPKLHRVVAKVIPTFEKQIFDVPKRLRISNVKHHNHADEVGKRVKISKGIIGLANAGRLAAPARPSL